MGGRTSHKQKEDGIARIYRLDETMIRSLYKGVNSCKHKRSDIFRRGDETGECGKRRGTKNVTVLVSSLTIN